MNKLSSSIRILLTFLLWSAACFGFGQSGLIAHYPMDGEAVDVSTFQNHGAIIGGVMTAPDRFGNPCGALEFNGSTGYISVPSSRSLKSPTQAFSVAVWIMPKAAPQDEDLRWLTICCKSDRAKESINSPQYRVQSTRVTVSINTAYTEETVQKIEYAKWHFYVLTYDGRRIKVFLNGTQIYNDSYVTLLAPNNMPLEIGRDVPGKTEFFSGIMDDLKLFNEALTPQEIASLHADQSAKKAENKLQIHCPQNITISATGSNCEAKVDFPLATASAPCSPPVVKQIYGLPSGSLFPSGPSSVAFSATNKAGNKVTCSFKINVQGKEAISVNCPGDVIRDANQGRDYAVVNYPDPAYTSPCSPATLSLVSGKKSGDQFPIGATKITYKATNQSGKEATCSFNITVIDKAPPALTCPIDLIKPNDKGRCDAIVNFSPPTSTDNHSGVTVTQTGGAPPGSHFPIGTSTVIYTAKDANGNKSTCQFTITVEDREKPSIDCPPYQIVEIEPDAHNLRVNYPDPRVADNCPGITSRRSTGPVSGTHFSPGKTEISYQATDAAGNQADCSFHIKVTQKQAPEPAPITLNCPKNRSVHTDPGVCSAMVSFPLPTTTGQATLTQIIGQKSGGEFNKGPNQIQFRALSPSGESLECGFTITVRDEEPPFIRCPGDLTLEAEVGESAMEAIFSGPEYSDNCPNVTLKINKGKSSGGLFPIGETVTQFTTTDAAGNRSSCSFRVIVKKKELPPVDKLTIHEPEPEPELPIMINEPEPPLLLDNGDTVIYQHTVNVKSKQIRIYYYDDNQQDGDIVSINFDGDWLVTEEKIKRRKRVLDITLDDRKVHYLISMAHNEGKKPWNTLKISIQDGSSRRLVFDLSSRKGRSSAIKLVFKP